MILAAVSLSLNSDASDGKYKKYDFKTEIEYLIKIAISPDNFILRMYGKDTVEILTFDQEDVAVYDNRIFIGERELFSQRGILYGDKAVSGNMIDKVEIKQFNKKTEIHLTKKSEKKAQMAYSRKNNRIALFGNVNVKPEEFIRGSALSIGGDLTINGEISGNVVALFGNIFIGETAVIRGEIVALGGSISITDGAKIHGGTLAVKRGDQYQIERGEKPRPGSRYFGSYFNYRHSRVDGGTPYVGLKFSDQDSTLPRILMYGGFGFGSEKPRYYLGIEHSMLKNKIMTVGGAIYRELATDDNRIVTGLQNTVFALIATEDYRDYYESIGGKIYTGFQINPDLYLKLGAVFEKHRRLNAHPETWSLFGGSKKFRDNFASLPDSLRSAGQEELDEASIFALKTSLTYNTFKNDMDWFDTFWKGYIEFEWPPKTANDDFNFNRLIFGVERQQYYNPGVILKLKAIYGNSDGNLPIHRLFYLGGMGTLYGYGHKEIYGDEFWMGSAKLGHRLKKTDFAIWLLFQLGSVGNDNISLGESEIKQSIGVSISLKDSLEMILSRRLDQSNPALKFNIRFGF
jgi:hypothetical protein